MEGRSCCELRWDFQDWSPILQVTDIGLNPENVMMHETKEHTSGEEGLDVVTVKELISRHCDFNEALRFQRRAVRWLETMFSPIELVTSRFTSY